MWLRFFFSPKLQSERGQLAVVAASDSSDRSKDKTLDQKVLYLLYFPVSWCFHVLVRGINVFIYIDMLSADTSSTCSKSRSCQKESVKEKGSLCTFLLQVLMLLFGSIYKISMVCSWRKRKRFLVLSAYLELMDIRCISLLLNLHLSILIEFFAFRKIFV